MKIPEESTEVTEDSNVAVKVPEKSIKDSEELSYKDSRAQF